MSASKGNKYSQKFKTPAERKVAVEAFLLHISSGYSAKSFHDPCVENTILKIFKDYPEEFDQELLSKAKAQSCAVWEKLGLAGTAGKIKNFNAGAWIFNMKNRLGWKDKQEIAFDKDKPFVFKLNMGKNLTAKKQTEEENSDAE